MRTLFCMFILILGTVAATAANRPPHRGRTYVVRGYGFISPYHRHAHSGVLRIKGPSGRLDINTKAKDAEVYVNGGLVGKAGRFDGWPGKLELKPGIYAVKIVHGDQVFRKVVRVTDGTEIDINPPF